MSPLPRRLRSFSLRTLMVLVGVVGLLAAWVGWQRSVVVKRWTARDGYGDGAVFLTAELMVGPFQKAPPLPRMRRWLGDELVWVVLLPPDTSDAEMARIAGLFPEATVQRWESRKNLPPLTPTP